jgi:glycosyltransferase involved in cell wall biosynthesis
MKTVFMINWDGYPNIQSGGVYSWEKILIDSMSDYAFIIFNLLSNSNSNSKFTVPSQVKQVISIPLFGSIRYQEFYNEKQSLVGKIFRTTYKNVIEKEFVPLFKELLLNVISDTSDPTKLAKSIFDIHKLIAKYDIKKCVEHQKSWEAFLQVLLADPLYKNITVSQALTIFQAIQRNLQIIAIRIPKCDLVHCSAAWLPSLIAICAKLEYACPLLVTEHGVAFRELIQYYNQIFYEEPTAVFWKMFARNIIRSVYAMADCISPVCYSNTNWEKKFDVDKSKIRVIYNGISVSRFRPMYVEKKQNAPTIVYVGRIERIKGVIVVIQTIKYVKEVIPNVLCLLYGGSSDVEYSKKCLMLVNDLDLADNVKFMGNTKEPEKAYNLGDVIVSFSFMEGFPFSIIEAMACQKAIVATDVGGVKEALEGCGIILKSNSHPREFASAIVKLLTDEKLRSELGAFALRKVKTLFTLEKMIEQYRQEYLNLIYCDYITKSNNNNFEIPVSATTHLMPIRGVSFNEKKSF